MAKSSNTCSETVTRMRVLIQEAWHSNAERVNREHGRREASLGTKQPFAAYVGQLKQRTLVGDPGLETRGLMVPNRPCIVCPSAG